MITRSDKLNRLQIRSTCETSWDAMEGSHSRRFCAECQREVFDFAQMTAREIKGHLEASRGRLCARLTRKGGRLVTLPTVQPPSSWAVHRTSSLAATLVSAWLSAGGAMAQPQPSVAATADSAAAAADLVTQPSRHPESQDSSGPGGRLDGRVSDGQGAPLAGITVVALNTLDGSERSITTRADGRFSFDALPPGLYDLDAAGEGLATFGWNGMMIQAGQAQHHDFTVWPEEETITMGGASFGSTPMREIFDESELVLTAVAGPSVVVRRISESFSEVETELRVETLVKGKLSGRSVTFQHNEYIQMSDDEEAQRFAPGTRLLAFLERSDETGRDGKPVFESADYEFGIKRLAGPAQAAYLARLDALARLERRAERRGEMEPAELMEWLVATAVDPLTRGEAMVELSFAFRELNRMAALTETTPELVAQDLLTIVDRFRAAGHPLSQRPRPVLLAASLTQDHKDRLTAALLADESLQETNWVLFNFVQEWREEVALAWLERTLRTAAPPPDLGELTWLRNLEIWDNPSWYEALDAAWDRDQELWGLWWQAASPAAQAPIAEEMEARRRGLRQQLLRALADGRGETAGPEVSDDHPE